MTTTTTASTTLADRYRIAGDLLARSDIAPIGLELRSHIGLKFPDRDWGSLRALYATLDDAHVTVYEYDQDKYAFKMILVVGGQFRGIGTWSQITVFDPADLDLIRSFTDENARPDGRLLDALAGDSREG